MNQEELAARQWDLNFADKFGYSPWTIPGMQEQIDKLIKKIEGLK